MRSVSKKLISFNWHVYIVQNESIQIKNTESRIKRSGAIQVDRLVLAPKWRHLWMEWIWILWTQLLDPTSKAKWLQISYMIPLVIKTWPYWTLRAARMTGRAKNRSHVPKILSFWVTSGLYYKHIMIINSDVYLINIINYCKLHLQGHNWWLYSDTPNCGITHW